MPSPLTLSKADARRALVGYQFAPCETQRQAIERLRSVQFDPIAPVGCNHDLVLQARVPGYKIGEWQKTAYEERYVYDGWDKRACLVPYEGWPLRRIYHEWYAKHFEPIFSEFPDAAEIILKDLEQRGPMQPKELEFQERRADWKGHWYSPNVTKRVLNALWHTGKVMTAGRRKGQHLYDLTERVMPQYLRDMPMVDEVDAMRELVLERHRAVGILRPSAPPEVWSGKMYLAAPRTVALDQLVEMGELIPVNVEGVKAHATPAFLATLDKPDLEPTVRFIAPLDQLVWDRKMIAHLFGFDYVWEIYVPEAKRRWGYYVLPVMFGNAFVGRAEFWCRKGELEMRRWHFEEATPDPGFWPELERSLRDFMGYCSATTMVADPGIDPKVRALVKTLGRARPAKNRS